MRKDMNVHVFSGLESMCLYACMPRPAVAAAAVVRATATHVVLDVSITPVRTKPATDLPPNGRSSWFTSGTIDYRAQHLQLDKLWMQKSWLAPLYHMYMYGFFEWS
jgi:hypothetical protein